MEHDWKYDWATEDLEAFTCKSCGVQHYDIDELSNEEKICKGKKMRVLVACEYSGRVRDAFTKMGHYAISCDFLPSETEGNHYQGDVKDIINDGWDLMIAHPPCTHLAVSGARYFKDKAEKQEEALEFVSYLLNAPIDAICLENPVGIISTRIRKPDQIIQPWMFGEDASKKTCLWLKNLPKLEPTNIIIKEIYANQTPSGQNKLGPSPDRWKERSRTYQGIADAMAEQFTRCMYDKKES